MLFFWDLAFRLTKQNNAQTLMFHHALFKYILFVLFGAKEIQGKRFMDSEIFLNGLLGVINQPVFIKDENFIYTYCNQEFADYMGFSTEQIIGSDVFQLYPEDIAEIYHQADVELFSAGGSQHYETAFRSKVGAGQTVIFHKSLLIAPDGGKIGIIGVVEIITELKKKEQELNKSENKYKKIFDNVQDIFYQVDLNGIIQDISPSVSKYSDYSSQEIIGQSIDMFYMNPEDRNLLIQEIQAKGEALDFEIKLKGKNNELNFASVNAHFITDAKGKVSGVEGTIRNLNERKLADEKLKLSLSLLHAALDSTADGILVINQTGKITNYNKQFKAIFNVPDRILESGDDTAAIDSVLNLFKDQEQFISKVKYLYSNPEKDSFDTLEFIDGRIIERFSCPQMLDGIPIGRVWSFRDVTARKQAEIELKENEERYRVLFDGSPDAIILADVETGIIIDANLASEKLFKRPVSEIVGLHQTELHPKKREHNSRINFKDAIDNARDKNELKSKEDTILCGDGTEIQVEIIANVIQIKGRHVLHGVFRETGERKLAEKALKDSEEKYRLLIENQGEGLTIVDPEENLIFVNPAAETIFGVEPGTLTGQNLKKFIAPDQFDLVLKETGKRTKNEKSSYELEILTPSGIRKNILVTATPQTDEKGKFIGTFGVLRDITARKEAEELLRRSETKYRNLIETMPDGVYRSTHDGQFVEVNPAMVKMLGYETQKELLTIDIKSQLYFAPEDRESLILDTKPIGLDVFPMKKKDGSTVWIEDHGWYIRDNEGKILFHEGILRDVTERKMIELQLHQYSEELQELNATKDKFFSIIAHDLKNPFNSIIGLSEILKDEAKHIDINTIEQYADIIYTTSNNTYRLLENLLSWALMQQGKIPFTSKSLIFKEMVDEIFELFKINAQNKNISLTNLIDENLIIHADVNMIKTVTRNLVSNAIKYTSSKGKIEVSAVSDGASVQVTVKDNGTGIRGENINKLFQTGSNFTRRGTENESGTGLGLILCKEFIEKHRGKIWVESEIGKGSEFKFILPV